MRAVGLVGVNGAPPKTVEARAQSVVIDARLPSAMTDARLPSGTAGAHEGRIWAA